MCANGLRIPRMDDKLKQAIALGREHYEKRDYDRAERYLAEVLAGGAPFADVYNMIGVIHHDRGRLEAARESFQKALAINPSYTEAALNLTVTCNDLGDYEAAQEIYRTAVRRDFRGKQTVDPYAKGKIANLHAQIAEAYEEVGMPNEAVAEYRSAIRLCPHFGDIRVRLAELYRQMGDHVAARYELEEAIVTRPDYVPARVALGVLWLVTGQRAKAVEAWQEALRHDPDNKVVQMYLRMGQNPPVPTQPPPEPPASGT
jgi:tetratricopeptide (TPR) repeat protein